MISNISIYTRYKNSESLPENTAGLRQQWGSLGHRWVCWLLTWGPKSVRVPGGY